MSMDQQQTFNWLVERDRKLCQIERVLERNVELCVALALEIAKENVAPIVSRGLDAENRTRGLHPGDSTT